MDEDDDTTTTAAAKKHAPCTSSSDDGSPIIKQELILCPFTLAPLLSPSDDEEDHDHHPDPRLDVARLFSSSHNHHHIASGNGNVHVHKPSSRSTNNTTRRRRPHAASSSSSSTTTAGTANPVPVGSFRGCGHACTLVPLIPFLQQQQQATCPVCHRASVGSVLDSGAYVRLFDRLPQQQRSRSRVEENEHRLLDHNTDDTGRNIVAFRYGKQSYYLTVVSGRTQSDRPGDAGSSSFAQDRIAHVLGMDAELGMKILHKGKLLHPHKTTGTSAAPLSSSSQHVSDLLLRVSATDIARCKKPSLVVMGTRTGSGLWNPNHTPDDQSSTTTGTVAAGSHRRRLGWLYHLLYDLLLAVVRTGNTIVGGLLVFVRSLLLSTIDDHHNTATTEEQ